MATTSDDSDPAVEQVLREVLDACELCLLSERQTAAAVEPLIVACERREQIAPEVVAAARKQYEQAQAMIGPAQQAIERFRTVLGVPSARH